MITVETSTVTAILLGSWFDIKPASLVVESYRVGQYDACYTHGIASFGFQAVTVDGSVIAGPLSSLQATRTAPPAAAGKRAPTAA